MIAIPSIDLHSAGSAGSGAGRRSAAPGPTARELADLGFSRLHIANGTSAKAGSFAIEDILRETSAKVEVGGITTTTEIEDLLRSGADLVVVGDRGVEEPDWLADVAQLYPDAIAARTDVRDRRVVRRGWVRTLPVDILDLVDELNAIPLHELMVSIRALDDGMRFGDLALLEDVAERSRCPVVVAGGVSSLEDLRALQHRGIAGAIIDADKLVQGSFNARDVAHEFGA